MAAARRRVVRILMVTPYPPVRDGIGNYAVQEVKALRAQGHDVEVLSPEPSAAHHHLELSNRRGPLALAKRVRAYDRIVVQYHPDMFFPIGTTGARRLEVTLGLLGAFRLAAEVEVRVHEVNYEFGRGRSVLAKTTRAMWRAADRISVHTEVERQRFAEAFGVPLDRITVAEHGESFVRRTSGTKEEARTRLGLPDDEFVFLSIGFVQPHKGFDRAVRAFARLGRGDEGHLRRLHVVGSVRLDDPHYLGYVEDLRDLVASTPGAHLREGYVGDETFDLWIVAADALVLPYRFIWSSGVIERAQLYERPVIATRVGGLADQAEPGTMLVDDDDELLAAMRSVLGVTPTSAAVVVPWPSGGRDAVMSEIRARAASERGSSLSSEANAGVALADPDDTGFARSAALRRVPPLVLPPPVSGRPGVSTIKRLIRRLTAWEVDPLVDQVNRLRDAVIESAEGRTPRAR
jgi:glycosyltransferase involved in cell wall biosynthesis